MKRMLFAAALVTFSAAAIAQTPALPGSKAPAGAEVYFIAPKDGATVDRDVTVRFGLKGMGVAPAGVARDHTGHHHLLVDATDLPPAGQPIPNDEHHKHFGGGQTETVLRLSPGTHTLQLELGDASHVPFDPPVVSKRITIHVK
ncbi:DUF4399 domain-containing protein [Frateuria sp. STR12]|uniref:DUF4399 domain-containing protein n=1 Tax=Frateuria hangzhouensis TaxID=2995589 RepID=UPI002260AEBE|nr:DUF4399 domain-containing protein [Frateuria sp. STR12]MCX7514822.1 DUF4399 domain-containing protein [Frateuria sp. STR12]